MSRFKPSIRRSSRQAYVRRFKGRNYPRRRAIRTYVPRTMGPFSASESKYFDSGKTATAITSGTTSWAGTELDPATLNTLVCPQEGSDIDNRVGRKIQVYKIAIRGVINPGFDVDQADALQGPAIRLILYMDEQTNGTQAQAEELMESGGTITQNFCSFQNKANFGRFRVLRDQTYRCPDINSQTDGANTASLSANDIPFKMTVKFKKPVVMKFNATNGGTIGDIVDNSFHLIGTISQTDLAPTISYRCRAYYKDH